MCLTFCLSFFFFSHDIAQQCKAKFTVGGYHTSALKFVSSCHSACAEVRVYPSGILEGQTVFVLVI